MRLEVEGIKIVGGQFSILPADPDPLAPTTDEKPNDKLLVSCKFALVSGTGIVAEGVASNVPGGPGTKTMLSETTLQAFRDFFNSLEHDIANSLSVAPKTKDEKNALLLEELMGRKQGN